MKCTDNAPIAGRRRTAYGYLVKPFQWARSALWWRAGEFVRIPLIVRRGDRRGQARTVGRVTPAIPHVDDGRCPSVRR